MLDCCPTCGGELPEHGLTVDLTSNVAICDGVIVRLTPTEAEILFVLNEDAWATLSDDYLIFKGWGLTEPEFCQTNLKIQILKLKRKLSTTAYKIENVWSKGYRLVKKDMFPEPKLGAA